MVYPLRSVGGTGLQAWGGDAANFILIAIISLKYPQILRVYIKPIKFEAWTKAYSYAANMNTSILAFGYNRSH